MAYHLKRSNSFLNTELGFIVTGVEAEEAGFDCCNTTFWVPSINCCRCHTNDSNQKGTKMTIQRLIKMSRVLNLIWLWDLDSARLRMGLVLYYRNLFKKPVFVGLRSLLDDQEKGRYRQLYLHKGKTTVSHR